MTLPTPLTKSHDLTQREMQLLRRAQRITQRGVTTIKPSIFEVEAAHKLCELGLAKSWFSPDNELVFSLTEKGIST